ncbi:hypothetical protein [Xanthomonas vesicatoria]|uniref:hypothetical protein n=1 Tax=Xanthomonas vesicatoria TaxID=56460 RepID=UPI001E44017C|nr:hypothetical protein [Xanthomonas vesicatoria]MCC8626455.1 hypothetical protein [Xanthomonas vesicatoria]MDG4481809.1 hypothetical protein [Xanthomonas vesicatoria]
MSKLKKRKIASPPAHFAAEVKYVHVHLAKVRAVTGAGERSKFIKSSSLVLKQLMQKAEADGVSITGVLAGPVRREGKRAILSSAAAASGSKALLLRRGSTER